MYRLDSLSTIKNYYSWILQEFQPFLGKRMLEVGAGIGTFTNFILSVKEVEKIFLLEPSRELMEHLKDTFKDNDKIEFVSSQAEDICPERIREMNIDTVVFVNVLEHIENDADVLRKFSAGLKPGSRILTFSPAFKLLYAHMDDTAGHYRRYTKKEIRQKLESSGLEVIYLRYFNILGFFSWFLFAKLLRANDFSKRGLKLYDSLIPFLQKMERSIPPPFGQSVIAIGEVKRKNA